MRNKSPQWINKWKLQKYPRLYPDFNVYGFGTDAEPGTSYWMSTLLDPLEDLFKEGMTILDYGCGGARLFNFITGYLEDFRYIGAEPLDGRELGIAKSYFEKDPRALFMTCKEAIASKAVLSCDVVILGSIFTHLLQKKCEQILESLFPVVDRGGMIVFTAMFEKTARVAGKGGCHDLADCYRKSFQKEDWIEELQQKYSRKIELVDKFACGVIQHVFRIKGDKI